MRLFIGEFCKNVQRKGEPRQLRAKSIWMMEDGGMCCVYVWIHEQHTNKWTAITRVNERADKKKQICKRRTKKKLRTKKKICKMNEEETLDFSEEKSNEVHLIEICQWNWTYNNNITNLVQLICYILLIISLALHFQYVFVFRHLHFISWFSATIHTNWFQFFKYTLAINSGMIKCSFFHSMKFHFSQSVHS